MFDVNTLSLFISASVLLALAPGPDNIFVLTQSAVKGWLVGLIVTLGLCTGLIVHTVAVAFGVAAIFQASELAFTALKLAGAAYLLYLAYKSLRAGAATLETENTEGVRLSNFYGRGIIMNVTNPKVSIFFLAFLPQFADPAKGPLPLQLITLGAIFMVVTFVVFGLISLLAGVIGNRFRKSPRMQILLNRVAGVVFIGLALKLATSNR